MIESENSYESDIKIMFDDIKTLLKDSRERNSILEDIDIHIPLSLNFKEKE